MIQRQPRFHRHSLCQVYHTVLLQQRQKLFKARLQLRVIDIHAHAADNQTMELLVKRVPETDRWYTILER